MELNLETDIIGTLLSEQMKALLVPSPRSTYDSAWHGHIAFANWLVSATKPKIIVELGTHFGVSYSTFCQAVKELDLSTKCFAIDTWEGDAHSGLYDNSVYEDLKLFNNQNYASFSILIRDKFDNALNLFEDGTIDILHIDGLHTYEAVKNDFNNWIPKLSTKAVVLFHDTEMRVEDFGVYRLWQEICVTGQTFDFKHSAGLGVLAYGQNVPPAILKLCGKTDLEAAILQSRFENLSKMVHLLGIDIAIRNKSSKPVRLDNIALNCAASQSSHYFTPAPTPQGAINGHKTGGFGFHTAYEQGAWWQVDLGEEKPIGEIVIYNRLDPFCRERAASLEIVSSSDEIEWQSVYQHNGQPFGGIDGFPLSVTPETLRARFIKIQLREENFLHLDEIEIYESV